MNTQQQFRVLYRQFLFRLMDVELLASSSGGDANKMFGQFAAMLVFGSLLSAYVSGPIGSEASRSGMPGQVWDVERIVISVNMLVIGVFALLSWDATFPDRRDVLVLGPLPVRARTLFLAKIAASATALGLVEVFWNCLSAFTWPLALAPGGSGFGGHLRFAAAFWITLIASGTFLYCAVLGIHALAAQLPRRWYLRVSSVVQIALFGLFLGVTIFQPAWGSAGRRAAWLPPYWFLGMLHELSGSIPSEARPIMASLARHAAFSLPIAILGAGLAFALSYLRTLRKIVEEPDIVPGARPGMWLPRFGSQPETALAQFVIRTLGRSRRHRVMLGFYAGGGGAIAALAVEGALMNLHLTWMDLIARVKIPLLGASVIVLCALWLGVRTAFSLPLDLRANWLFRIAPVPGPASCLRATRRALLSSAVFPVLAVSAPSLFVWPWTLAAGHLLLLALLGSILADASLKGFRKIPFTCSYLPGKTKTHLVFWFGILPLVVLIETAAEWELRAMAKPPLYWCVALALGAVAIVARRLANTGIGEIYFEDFAADDMIGLGLSQ